MVGRTSLRATGSMHSDVNTKGVLTEPQQLSVAVLIFFSRFVDGLFIQGTLKYREYFSWPNRFRVEN